MMRLTRWERIKVWIKAHKGWVVSALVILFAILVRLLIPGKKRVPVKVTVSSAVEDAAREHDQAVIEAIEKVASARGEEKATKAQVTAIQENKNGRARRRALADLMRSQRNG